MPATVPTPVGAWCLFLDVDGTLIDIADAPAQARAGRNLKVLLREISTLLGGSLALISGRSIRSLDALFAPLRLACAGLHGIERRDALGRTYGDTGVDANLLAARARLHAFAAAHPGTSLEDKERTLALHYRPAPGLEARIRRTLGEIAGQLGPAYHVQEGRLVFEIKTSRRTKGSAVEAFLREAPFADKTPVYVGDDDSDRDGFRVVEAFGGMSVGVGDRVRAQHRIDGPRAVRAWLRRIAAAAGALQSRT